MENTVGVLGGKKYSYILPRTIYKLLGSYHRNINRSHIEIPFHTNSSKLTALGERNWEWRVEAQKKKNSQTDNTGW